MILTIIPNHYDREITEDNEIYFDHNDLIDLIENPTVSLTKNSSPYIIPFTHTHNYTTKDNAHSLTALFLDIDDSITIKQFKSEFKFKYYLYTTYNHSHSCNKFRVIVPIARPLTVQSYSAKFFKQWLCTMFPYSDPKAWGYRGYYSPCCKDTYEYYYNDGEIFDFMNYSYEIEKERDRWKKRDKLLQARRKRLDERYSDRPTKVSVRQNAKVVDFLSGSYRTKGGNLPFYTALSVCKTANDSETKDLVVQEARRGGWTETEINRKLRDSGWL